MPNRKDREIVRPSAADLKFLHRPQRIAWR